MSKRDILVSKARDWIRENDHRLYHGGYSITRAAKQFRIQEPAFKGGHFAAIKVALEGWSTVDGPQPKWEGIGVTLRDQVAVQSSNNWQRLINSVRDLATKHPDAASSARAMAAVASVAGVRGARNVNNIREAMIAAGMLKRKAQ